MRTNLDGKNAFQVLLLVFAIVASLSLFGYATVNAIRMPNIGPDAFVPKDVTPGGRSVFGALQLIFILGFSFSLLPVSAAFAVRRYADNPAGLIIGTSFMVLALLLEIVNNLPFLGYYVYPGQLAGIPRDVMLHLNQSAAVRYLAFDVAGFSLLYAALLTYAAVSWRRTKVLAWLVLASLLVFLASAPLLWINGSAAVLLLGLSVYCTVPIPLYLWKQSATPDSRGMRQSH